MIARLEGVLIDKGAAAVVLDCGGVGYEVHCTLPALEALPAVGEKAALAIHTQVKEDAISLFGFAATDERDVFRLAIGVSGIGPRIGMALLSTFSPGELQALIMAEDHAALSRVPGIGPKTAKRLVLELRDRLRRAGVATASATVSPAVGVWQDLHSGLLNLGYKPVAVEQVVDALRREQPDANLTSLLKESLARLSRS